MTMKYCSVCCNATVEPELNPDNDLGYIGVGETIEGYGLHIRSGDGRPTALIISRWNKVICRNVEIGSYKMKFCPECGRELTENLKEDIQDA